MNRSVNYLILVSSALALAACSQAEFTTEASATAKKSESSNSSSSVGAGSSQSSGVSSGAGSSGSSSSGSGAVSSGSGSSSSGSVSSGSGSSGAASSAPAASMPKSACVNVSQGGLNFKIESPQTNTFQSMRITSFPATLRGGLESYAIYKNGSGALTYTLASAEPYLNDEYDDFFYKCVITFDELLAFGQRKGYSSVKAQIPNLVIQAWLDSPENLVGLALKNPITKEFAVQCF